MGRAGRRNLAREIVFKECYGRADRFGCVGSVTESCSVLCDDELILAADQRDYVAAGRCRRPMVADQIGGAP